MNIRPATQGDLATVRELWAAFYTEWPEPPHRQKGWGDYVRPEFRRRGTGRALISEVAVGLGREYVALTTETRNEPARAYYRRLGFQEESVNFVIRSEALT
jgi:GNAT superfamily N-acetyltransferase